MSTYARRQEELREFAIEWQATFEDMNLDWLEYANWMAYFETMGRRYGLLREFRENGIC